MPDISKINVDGTVYDIKDEVARQSSGGGVEEVLITDPSEYFESIPSNVSIENFIFYKTGKLCVISFPIYATATTSFLADIKNSSYYPVNTTKATVVFKSSRTSNAELRYALLWRNKFYICVKQDFETAPLSAGNSVFVCMCYITS